MDSKCSANFIHKTSLGSFQCIDFDESISDFKAPQSFAYRTPILTRSSKNMQTSPGYYNCNFSHFSGPKKTSPFTFKCSSKKLKWRRKSSKNRHAPQNSPQLFVLHVGYSTSKAPHPVFLPPCEPQPLEGPSATPYTAQMTLFFRECLKP